jgi:hypothetical protein
VGICQIVQLFQVVTGFMARFTNVQFAKLTIKLSREKGPSADVGSWELIGEGEHQKSTWICEQPTVTGESDRTKNPVNSVLE